MSIVLAPRLIRYVCAAAPFWARFSCFCSPLPAPTLRFCGELHLAGGPQWRAGRGALALVAYQLGGCAKSQGRCLRFAPGCPAGAIVRARRVLPGALLYGVSIQFLARASSRGSRARRPRARSGLNLAVMRSNIFSRNDQQGHPAALTRRKQRGFVAISIAPASKRASTRPHCSRPRGVLAVGGIRGRCYTEPPRRSLLRARVQKTFAAIEETPDRSASACGAG